MAKQYGTGFLPLGWIFPSRVSFSISFVWENDYLIETVFYHQYPIQLFGFRPLQILSRIENIGKKILKKIFNFRFVLVDINSTLICNWTWTYHINLRHRVDENDCENCDRQSKQKRSTQVPNNTSQPVKYNLNYNYVTFT